MISKKFQDINENVIDVERVIESVTKSVQDESVTGCNSSAEMKKLALKIKQDSISFGRRIPKNLCLTDTGKRYAKNCYQFALDDQPFPFKLMDVNWLLSVIYCDILWVFLGWMCVFGAGCWLFGGFLGWVKMDGKMSNSVFIAQYFFNKRFSMPNKHIYFIIKSF